MARQRGDKHSLVPARTNSQQSSATKYPPPRRLVNGKGAESERSSRSWLLVSVATIYPFMSLPAKRRDPASETRGQHYAPSEHVTPPRNSSVLASSSLAGERREEEATHIVRSFVYIYLGHIADKFIVGGDLAPAQPNQEVAPAPDAMRFCVGPHQVPQRPSSSQSSRGNVPSTGRK